MSTTVETSFVAPSAEQDLTQVPPTDAEHVSIPDGEVSPRELRHQKRTNPEGISPRAEGPCRKVFTFRVLSFGIIVLLFLVGIIVLVFLLTKNAQPEEDEFWTGVGEEKNLEIWNELDFGYSTNTEVYNWF